jgi:hypothetical protein
MVKSFFYFALAGILFLLAVVSFGFGGDESPDGVIAELYDAIGVAEENGVYNCCIEPACTMCYLGHWKFEKGTCDCDAAIAEGRFEDVCPECKGGLEKGTCDSLVGEECLLDEEKFGGNE